MEVTEPLEQRKEAATGLPCYNRELEKVHGERGFPGHVHLLAGVFV